MSRDYWSIIIRIFFTGFIFSIIIHLCVTSLWHLVGWMNERMNEWRNEWKDEWVKEWMKKCLLYSMIFQQNILSLPILDKKQMYRNVNSVRLFWAFFQKWLFFKSTPRNVLMVQILGVYLHLYKVVISVCLFVCLIITRKPLDLFASKFWLRNSGDPPECS